MGASDGRPGCALGPAGRRFLAAAVLAVSLGAGTGGSAQPLPPPRPPDLPKPAETNRPARPAPVTTATCLDALRAAGVVAERAEQAATVASGCRIEDPVRLSALAAPTGRPVALPERPVLACAFARTFASWASAAVATVGAKHGAVPAAIATGPGWDCRGRNRQAGARLSAHATGIAIDIAGFVLADRSRLDINLATRTDPALVMIRRAACETFTTVLGPGGDRFHDTHLHVDAQQHGRDGSFKICQ